MANHPSSHGTVEAPDFTELNDLGSSKIGARVIYATDDWFARAESLLQTEPPVFDPAAFTEFGKLMDGWETRRKRIPGHDWCIIQLGAPGVIHGVDLDTSFFTGNHAPKASLQAAALDADLPARLGDRTGTTEIDAETREIDRHQSQTWTEILPVTALKPGYMTTCHNYFRVNSGKRWTHLRLNIYPDGGVARLRVYGQVTKDWSRVPQNQSVDLVAMLNGGICVGYSNVHFGHARNMIGPGRSVTMADGWETARRLDRPEILRVDANGLMQVPGSEWAVLKLGHPGIVSKIEIDTNLFKGNFPDRCWIEGCLSSEKSHKLPVCRWRMLLPPQKLSAHARHHCGNQELRDIGVVSHIRVSMAPDGGISRVRVWGHRAPQARI